MNKQGLYEFALSVMDLELVSMEESSKEKKLLDLNYDKVIQFVLKAWDFPFLIKKVQLLEADLTDDVWKYSFGYHLPDDFGHVVQLDGSRKNAFSIRFGVLWTDIPEPILEYIPDTLPTDVEGNFTAPSDFMALVGYQLALHVAPFLDPDGQSAGIAAQMYQLTLESIKEHEARANDRDQNYGADTPWGEEEVFDLAEYRRLLFEDSR
jgi:hypothetical protein